MPACVLTRYLLYKGASKEILTEDGERPLDLVEPTDLHTIGAMLESADTRTARLEERDEEEEEEQEEEEDQRKGHESPSPDTGSPRPASPGASSTDSACSS